MSSTKLSASTGRRLRLIALAAGLMASVGANAHPGDFDSHFGSGGKATLMTDVRSSFTPVRIAVDRTNRIVFGYDVNSAGAKIAALDGMGHLDTTFGTAGFIDLLYFYDIKVDSRNRYVVLGYTAAPAGVTVMRYLNNGRPDPSFGKGGVATVTAEGSFATAIAVDKYDNIVIAGGQSTSDSIKLFAARVTANGELDDTFGRHGIRTIPLSMSSSDFMSPQAVAIDRSDNIYLSGYSSDAPVQVNQLFKLKPDGSLDKHFGYGTGSVSTDAAWTTPEHFTVARSIAVDEDDNVLLAGSAGDVSSSELLVARYRADGSFDPTFNGGALKLFEVETSMVADAQTVLVDQHGRIVLTGIGQDGVSGDIKLLSARLKKDGTFDHSFGAHLLPTSAFNGAGAFANNGNILIAGDSTASDAVIVDELKGN
jgi:uncharacterized delta-60 repeat protein